MPLVSVVIPMYNSEPFIADCLQSVLASTFEDIEVLVVNDGSTDGSIEEVSAFLRDPRVRLLQAPKNQGVAAARNQGIEAATGRYIAFCDSDDLWQPEKLERQLAALQRTGTAVSHTSVYYAKPDKTVLMSARPDVTWDDMKVRNWIANSSGIYDSDKLGKILQSRMRHEDYEMWCLTLKSGGFSVGVEEPLVTINRREDSVSSNKLQSLLWHMEAQRKIFGMTTREIVWRMAENIATRLGLLHKE